MIQETCACALGAWKNARPEAPRGRKGTAPTWCESDEKERKVAFQSARTLAQHTKRARPPSRLTQQCEKRVARARTAARWTDAAFSGAWRLPSAQCQVRLEVQIAPAARALLVADTAAPGSLM